MVIFNTLQKHGNGRLNYWHGESSLTEKDYHGDDAKEKPGPKRWLDQAGEFLMIMM